MHIIMAGYLSFVLMFHVSVRVCLLIDLTLVFLLHFHVRVPFTKYWRDLRRKEPLIGGSQPIPLLLLSHLEKTPQTIEYAKVGIKL